MENKTIDNLVDILGKFKDLKRSGWIKRQVRLPESDADHSFSVALICWLLAPDELNKQKCLELALTHDLAEIYAGDPTPVDKVSPQDKYNNEKQAITKIAAKLNKPELIELFEELETQKTKESIFVKGIDRLDNVVTASWYDKTNRAPQKLLPEFGNYSKRCLAKTDTDITGEISEIVEYLLNKN